MRTFVVVPLFTALACGSAPESTVSKDPPPRSSSADTKLPPTPEQRPDPCGAAALGLGQATVLALWTPPPGCSPRGNGKSILRSDADLAPRLECSAGQHHLVDFTKHALLVVDYTLSPAGAGLGALDDGRVITLVSRQRNPCPGGPMPMPMNATAWFLLPAGGERGFADTTCTVESQCP